MKSSAKKVELASVDDLFTTEESRADAGREKVVEIPLSELHSFKGHPFKVKDDDAMMETADSIRQYGVLVPAIARPDPNGGYELVAGHRRHRASELAEKETIINRIQYFGQLRTIGTTGKQIKRIVKREGTLLFCIGAPLGLAIGSIFAGILNAEPVIEESVFLIVQNIRQGRRRPTKMGDMGMFSGLVYCADCGGKMYLCRANHFKPEQEYYICSTYRKDRTLCKTHSIRRVVLEEIVLRNLREAISYVTQYEDDFIQRAAERSLRERDKALAQKKAVLAQSEKRIAELDVIFKRIYEDNISGKLSDDRFIKLSRDYEQEQEQLKAVVETLGREVKQQEQKKTNVRKFISVVRKHTDMTQFDATILREFVEQIRVSDTYTTDEQQKRVKIREIEIVYNFIGAFDFEGAREQSQTAQDQNNAKVGAA